MCEIWYILKHVRGSNLAAKQQNKKNNNKKQHKYTLPEPFFSLGSDLKMAAALETVLLRSKDKERRRA